MRYALLACLLALAIAFDLAVFLSTYDDSLEPFDPLRPATLFPIVAARVHVLKSQVRELDIRHFVETVAAPYRKHGRDVDPAPTPQP